MKQVLFEELGPNGNVAASVESDGDTCYFYLLGAAGGEFGIRAVWLRNLVDAPLELDRERMNRGVAPINPAPYCRHPHGTSPPSPDGLEVVWLPEGNGAALFDDGEPLAIIPPWSGVTDFDGYSRDCIGEGPLAWELRSDNAMLPRIEAARAYWSSWDEDEMWPRVQKALLEDIEAALGPHTNYFLSDNEQWPRCGVILVPRGRSVAMVTLGMCIRPQPNVELQTERPELFRRIELGVVVPVAWTEKQVERLAQYMLAQAQLPWTHYSWLGPGHTLPCDSWLNETFDFAVLTRDHPGAPTPSFADQFGDPIHVLWLQPITEGEREQAIEAPDVDPATMIPNDRWCSS